MSEKREKKEEALRKGPDPKAPTYKAPVVPEKMGGGGRLVEQTKKIYKQFPK